MSKITIDMLKKEFNTTEFFNGLPTYNIVETFFAIYKCRMCNMLYEIKCKEIAVLSTMINAIDGWAPDTRRDLAPEKAIPLTRTHQCHEDQAGVSDFIGYRTENN